MPDDNVDQTASVVERQPLAFWKVGLGLLALILVIVAAAVLLNQRLRPQVGIEPAPTPLPAVAATQGPEATKVAAVAAVMATPTLPGGLRIGNSPLEREIEAAYLHYWDVRTQAYLALDSSRLPEVMANDELTRNQKQIADLKAQGRAAKLDVEHQIAFAKVAPDSAIVYDEYLNKSVFVDMVTKEELKTSEPPEREKISFDMQKIDGAWKVVGGVRHE